MNKISKLANIDEKAIIGKNNIIGPFVNIGASCVIGDNNYFAPGVSIGTDPRQRIKPKKWETIPNHIENSNIIIGSNCVFFENVTIHNPILNQTLIKDNVVVLPSSFIAHDCIINDNVIISSNVVCCGYTIIDESAYIGTGVSIHQRSVIGSFSAIGSNAFIKGYVYPYIVVAGVPGKFVKVNKTGLLRNGFNEIDIQNIQDHLINENDLPIHLIEPLKRFEIFCEMFYRDTFSLNIIKNFK